MSTIFNLKHKSIKYQRIISLFCVVGILLSLLFSPSTVHSQQIGFQLSNNSRRVEIPFEVKNNLIIVPIILNGVLPLKFIVDTGVQSTILTEKAYADILDIDYGNRMFLTGPGTKDTIFAYVARDVSLNMPGITGLNQSMLVLEEDYLNLKYFLGDQVHGIIGYDLFSRFVVEFNFSKETMTLHEPKYYRPNFFARKLEIEVIGTKPYINSQAVMPNGKRIKVKLLIDSGASHALLLHPESDPDIYLPVPSLEAFLGRGLGGDISGHIGRIQLLRLGRYKIKKPLVSFPDEASYGRLVGKSGRHGTIGGRLLTRMNFTIDYHNNFIYYSKNLGFNKTFEYDMSGMELMTIGPDLDQYIIKSIRRDMPADEVGLQPGDTLLSINGQDPKKLGLDEITGTLRQRNNKKIRVRVKRGENSEKLVFRLRKVL